MKSLILKDLYNVIHNAKSMLFMLLVFAFIFIPLYGGESYLVTCGIICSMMVITTFSFDERSKWMRYVLITPVTKRDIVVSKFLTLFLLSFLGIATALVLSFFSFLFLHHSSSDILSSIIQLLFASLISLSLSMTVGGISIPLLFQFGVEKARLLSLVSVLIPAAAIYGTYQLLHFFQIPFTDHTVFLLLCICPFAAVIWDLVMYKISLMIFLRKEPLD